MYEYVFFVFLVVGFIIFTLAGAQMSPNFNALGVIMVSEALIMDSFLGNLQEAIFKMNLATSQMEMLFCSMKVALPLLIILMGLTCELFRSCTSCSQHLYVYLVLIFEEMATFVS